MLLHADLNVSGLIMDNMRELVLDYLEQPYYNTNDLHKITKLKIQKPKKVKLPNPEYKNLGEEILKVFDKDNVKRWWLDHWHAFEESKREVKLKALEAEIAEIKMAVAA